MFMMSSIRRFIPQSLCCLYTIDEQQHDEPSPLRPVSAAPTVSRRPIPYAMINVPHAPEMTDVHQFRRIFTQSPACPHENTPIGGSPERPRPRPQGSLDLNYAFHSGSPASIPKPKTSLQRISRHLKQKLSGTSINRTNSLLEKEDHSGGKNEPNDQDPSADENAIMLGISMRSTGLSDLLRSREGSADVYDSDAHSIRTPYLRSAVGTMQIASGSARKALLEAEIHPKDSISNYESSPKPALTTAATAGRDLSPEKTLDEVDPIVVANDLASTNSGHSDTILCEASKPQHLPNEIVRRTVRSASSSEQGGVSLDTHARPLSHPEEPNTPQTIVKFQHEHAINCGQVSGNSEVPARSSASLKELDPALLEYLARFGTSNSATNEAAASLTPEATVIHQEGTNQNSLQHSRTDLASINSHAPSEQSKSVHLFNMHISRQLASKSTANMLSPSASTHTSRKSFDLSGTAATEQLADSLSVATMARPTRVRAEHLRRPSDPQTRQLFEQPGNPTRPNWTRRSVSIGRSNLGSRDRDDASSFYTFGGGPPSSIGNLSYMDGAKSGRNMNSLAVGGRSVSSSLPLSHTRDSASTLKPGSFEIGLTTSNTEQHGRVAKAANTFTQDFDGSAEPCDSHAGVPISVFVTGEQDNEDRLSNRVSANQAPSHLQVEGEPGRRLSAGWLTDGQRYGWNYDFVGTGRNSDRRLSALSMVAPDADPLATQESATDMWNRAFHDARNSASRDLLSTPTIEMDSLRRPSSLNTVRPKHRSSILLQEPETVVRRSRSADPSVRRGLPASKKSSYSSLTKTLKRLSLRQLKRSREQLHHTPGPRKLQKKNSPSNTRTPSVTPNVIDATAASSGNVTPLKERFGIWASFPINGCAKRNGPAGEGDHIDVRDFCHAGDSTDIENKLVTPNKIVNVEALSAKQSTLRMLSIRSQWLDKHKSRSMTFEDGYHHRLHKPRRVLFLHRWRRLYRTKSSEWHGYRTTGGHRSSVSAGQPAEFPELESLPGEGLFGRGYGTFDGTSAPSTPSPVMDSEKGTHRISTSPLQSMKTTTQEPLKAVENVRWLRTSDSSLWEPVLDLSSLHVDRTEMQH